jgi:hypothetical protein
VIKVHPVVAAFLSYLFYHSEISGRGRKVMVGSAFGQIRKCESFPIPAVEKASRDTRGRWGRGKKKGQ